MGMIPDPRQIGDGGGDGPPIPGKSGIIPGMIPDCRRVPEQLHLMGSRMSPRLASVAVITRGRRVRRRHNDIRFRFRMLMLGAGLMLQCQLDDARFLLLPACLPAFGVASCSRLESERHSALLSSPLLSSESPCLDAAAARLDDRDGGSRCRRLGFPGRVLAWCCWRDRPGTCRRPSPRCIASAPLFKFVVAIGGGGGVGSVTA